MKKLKVNITELYFFSTILFVVNPFLGVISLFHILISNIAVNKEKLINLFVFLITLFITFINITKIPENDLYFHAMQYKYVEGLGLIEYLKYIEKEPFGYIYNYVMYHLTGGSVKYWVFTFTFVSYFLFFTAVKRFFTIIQLPKNFLLLGLMLAAFFPQLFSLSAHLIRQFIASSIFIFYAVDKIFYNKNRWWLVVIGVLTHGSSVLLYSLVFFKFLGNFRKYKFLNIALILTLIFYQTIAKLLLNIIGGFNSSLDYILQRASRDTTFNLGEFQLMNFVMMFVMIFVAIYGAKHLIKTFNHHKVNSSNNEKSINEQKKKEGLDKKLRFFFSTMILLSVFILINIKQSELSNRLFFYLFFYFPFVMPLALLFIKEKNLVSYLVSILFVVYFGYRLEYGVWTYASLGEICTNSTLSFLSYPEPDLEYKKFYW